MRPTAVDFPRPGSAITNTLGLLISLARWNQLIGSQHTVAPLCRCRPNGTPIIGLPVPIAYGHSPHTCTVVPRHMSGACTY